MKKIDIFGCGVQKAGTTTLFHYLSQHPDLTAPSRKELHFFDDESLDWDAPNYSALDSFFNSDSSGVRFEVTPIYIYWPKSLSRIKAYNPNAKLIFLFRDPFERAWSHWCMEYARGAEVMPFDRAIRDEVYRINDESTRRICSYVDRGRYGRQVSEVLNLFPKEQVLFLLTSEFEDNYNKIMNKIFEFIEISPLKYLSYARKNTRANITFPCAPTKADRTYIWDVLEDDLRIFSHITELSVDKWKL